MFNIKNVKEIKSMKKCWLTIIIFFSSYHKLYLVQLLIIATSLKLYNFKLSKERKITNT